MLKIKILPKILLAVASILLLLLFFMPIWRITLEAPQYPDGINMYIWINKITGDTDYTLQNVNILNHYIGMKNIEPDSIPELSFFPYIVIGMVVLGILISFTNKKFLYLGWPLLLIILGILGLYDFYLWEYDYGHNLNPQAPIKIPGMVYQPPLFGHKMLLNFNAESYPDCGSHIMAISIFLSIAAFYLLWKRKSKNHEGETLKSDYLQNIKTASIAFVLSLLLFSCAVEPQPIEYGKDACHFCKMTIMDNKFGAELVTEKGKVLKFDATECMIHFLNEQQGKSQYANVLVTDYSDPGTLKSAAECSFLHSKELPSPMGMYLTSFEKKEVAEQFQQKHGGQVYNWEQLNKNFLSLSGSLVHQ